MKLTRAQQYIIMGVVLFGGVLFAYYQFWLQPVNAQITQLTQTLSQKQKELEEAERIVKKYAEFKKRADSVQRELEWTQTRMPKAIDKSKLLEAVNFIQARSGVILTNFQFLPIPAPKDAWAEVPVSVKFTGDYKGLLAFLYQSTLTNPMITAKDIAVNPLKDPSRPDVTLTAQLTLNGVQSK